MEQKELDIYLGIMIQIGLDSQQSRHVEHTSPVRSFAQALKLNSKTTIHQFSYRHPHNISHLQTRLHSVRFPRMSFTHRCLANTQIGHISAALPKLFPRLDSRKSTTYPTMSSTTTSTAKTQDMSSSVKQDLVVELPVRQEAMSSKPQPTESTSTTQAQNETDVMHGRGGEHGGHRDNPICCICNACCSLGKL